MRACLVLPAAGMGLRLGRPEPKALVPILDTPLIVWTLRRLAPLDLLHEAVITVPESQEDRFGQSLGKFFPGNTFRIVPGGAERQDSVRGALAHTPDEGDIVVIHDAARPFVPEDAVREGIVAAARHGAATVAQPAIDTILRVDDDGFLVETPPRSEMWACQTPQIFRKQLIVEAHERALAEGFKGTDDATLVRWLGKPVKVVAGSPENLKVTTPRDLLFAKLLLEENAP